MDKFNTLVDHLFGRLYDGFPVPLRIRPEQFLNETIEEDDFEGSFNFMEYYESTVKWLETVLYIWVTQDLSEGGVRSRPVSVSLR